MGEPIPL